MGVPFGGFTLPIDFLNRYFHLPKRNGDRYEKEPPMRYNHLDAFRDLLWRACEQWLGQTTCHGKTVTLTAGQFIVTFSELAADWLWHRTDTKNFLLDLQERGYITVEEMGKFCLVSFTRHKEQIAKFIAEHPETQKEKKRRKRRVKKEDKLPASTLPVAQEDEHSDADKAEMQSANVATPATKEQLLLSMEHEKEIAPNMQSATNLGKIADGRDVALNGKEV